MRPIDADELRNEVDNYDFSEYSDYSNMIDMIDDAPTIEAEPVKHGRWIINPDGYYPYCSECKEEPKSGKMTRFCQNCGARMDGGDDDEEP